MGWLLTQPGTEADSGRIAEALLVTLVLRGDRKRVRLLLDEYQDSLEQPPTESVWRDLLPDVRERAQAMTRKQPADDG